MKKDLITPSAIIRGEDDFRQEALEVQRRQLISKMEVGAEASE